MQTGSSRRYDAWDSEAELNNIIYLPYRSTYNQKRSRSRRRKRAISSDAIWNAIFATLCLSVLVVLFLH